MAVGLSNAMENNILNWLFNRTTFPNAATPPSNLYISLHSGAAGANDDAGSLELSTGTGSYARKDILTDAVANTNWNTAIAGSPATSQKISNKVAITFVAATADWNGGAAIFNWGAWDTVTAGIFLFGGLISGGGVVVLNTNQLVFAGGTPGALSFQLD